MKIKKNKYFLNICCLFIFFNWSTYSETYEKYEDIYVEIKSKKLKDDFFLLKYDNQKKTILIGLKSFFYFLELYGMKINMLEKMVIGEIGGRKKTLLFSDVFTVIIDDDLYIEIETLEKKLDFKNIIWKDSDLRLTLTPNFILPYEEKEKSKVERIRLADEKIKDNSEIINGPKKYLSPGVLKINYSQYDIKKSENDFSLEYATQFLFGDLYLNQELKPVKKLERYSLTYNKVYKNNDIILGNFSMKTPNFLNTSNIVRGINFGETNTYSYDVDGVIVIKGEAQGAEIIELYQNGILIDYQNPKNRNFIFENYNGNYSGEYSLKIYYQNGKIENRKVYTINDSNFLKKGEAGYLVQIGQVEEKINYFTEDDYTLKKNKKIQKIGQIRYGLKDNLTTGLEFLDIDSKIGRPYKILKNELLYKTNLEEFPTMINIQNYFEYREKENSYEIKLEQKLKKWNLKLNINDYSKYLGYEKKVDKKITIGILKDFIENKIEMGCVEEIRFDEMNIKKRGYYINYENRSLRSTSLILNGEIKKDKFSKSELYLNPLISYNNFNRNLNLILQAYIRKEDRKTETEYSLKFSKRRYGFKATSLEYSYGIEARYSNRDKFLLSLEFNLYVDDFLYLELPFTRNSSNESQLGVSLEKTIDLSNLRRKIDSREVTDSWIYGKIFIDSNNNSIYDKGEESLSGVKLLIEGKNVVTDINGDYTVPGLLPTEKYNIKIDRKTMDIMLKEKNENIKIETKSAIGTHYDIPIQPISVISGNIIPNKDISQEEFMKILSLFTIVLEKNGNVYKEIDIELDGFYFFEDVLPGKYKIKFIYLGNQELSFSKQELEINVKLEKENEGEYFEGLDTNISIIKPQAIEEETSIEKEDSLDIDEIIDNF